MQFIVKDPHFTIKSNGAVVAVSPVYVPSGGRTFSVWAQDSSTPESEMEVHLVHSTLQKTKVKTMCTRLQSRACEQNAADMLVKHFLKTHSLLQQTERGFLKRTKRRWSPPPINILENDVGPYPKPVETVIFIFKI